jgi:hypothetical protein
MKNLGLSAFVGLLIGLAIIWWLQDPGAPLNAGAIALVLLITTSAFMLFVRLLAWVWRRWIGNWFGFGGLNRDAGSRAALDGRRQPGSDPGQPRVDRRRRRGGPGQG